jgi:hypothetical protein
MADASYKVRGKKKDATVIVKPDKLLLDTTDSNGCRAVFPLPDC